MDEWAGQCAFCCCAEGDDVLHPQDMGLMCFLHQETLSTSYVNSKVPAPPPLWWGLPYCLAHTALSMQLCIPTRFF